MTTTEPIFVPMLAPALKHPTILKKFNELKVGDSFLLINDHDPIPLFYELQALNGPVFEWRKLTCGPEIWEIEIERTAENQTKESKAEEVKQPAEAPDSFVLNVTKLEPRMKHPTIFKYFDELTEGQSFRILNDHDPKPLYYQMIAERGNIFTWTYHQTGPAWWEVEIRKNNVGETIGELAAKDLRKAAIFKKYGIDFCCGGKRTLEDVCKEKGIDKTTLEAELNEQTVAVANIQNDYNKWKLDFLADYIYNQHHVYYYEESPVIKDLLDKIIAHHGAKYAHLSEIASLFAKLQCELGTHFIKEEKVVFPFIKALVAAKKTGDLSGLKTQPSIADPVHMMEADHEAAGDLLAQLRKITNDYQVPEGACNSFRLLYKKLEDLESDLIQHIHLENNILFRKSLEMDKELRKS